MIKANELRIGNWVHCYNFTFKVLKITAIYVTDYPDGENGAFFFDKLEPIPLTPETLIKCGFNEFSKNYFVIGDYSVLQDMGGWHFDYVDADNRGMRSIAYPQYLHQLQNLYFALTGEELKVTL